MQKSPVQIIGDTPMGRAQIIVVALSTMLNALDGFDVLSIAFASPGIAEEWNVNRAVLGIVLAMELLGMAIGSVSLGSLADNIGRRPVILSCLIVMAIGMYMAGTADSVNLLSLHRFYTGLAIGGVLATVGAIVAEFSNHRHRHLCVIIMSSGYPFGVIVGGTIASGLLEEHSWRTIFEFGSLITICFLPLAWWLLPESVAFLSIKHGNSKLAEINRVLSRLGKPTVETIPALAQPVKAAITGLFKPDLIKITVVLTTAYFLHMMTLYFLLKWTPKIVADMGYTASVAGKVLVWANIGMLIGSVVTGLLSSRYSIRHLMFVALTGSSVMICVFGAGFTGLRELSVIAFVTGVFINAGVVGLYALLAQYYPHHLRASGTGFSIGVGRGGAVSSPIMVGILFNLGFGLGTVASLMALGSLIAMIVLIFLPKHEESFKEKEVLAEAD